MFTPHPAEALFLAHQRGRRLRAEAEAEHLRGPSPLRGLIATHLRSAADRLDPAPLWRQPAR